MRGSTPGTENQTGTHRFPKLELGIGQNQAVLGDFRFFFTLIFSYTHSLFLTWIWMELTCNHLPPSCIQFFSLFPCCNLLMALHAYCIFGHLLLFSPLPSELHCMFFDAVSTVFMCINSLEEGKRRRDTSNSLSPSKPVF